MGREDGEDAEDGKTRETEKTRKTEKRGRWKIGGGVLAFLSVFRVFSSVF
jgi:hypothetical protein